MSFTLNITKWLLKALFLGIFALIWIGYQATNAGYVDGLYVWDNAQRDTLVLQNGKPEVHYLRH